ncbi:DUF2993 domain-containing protein [bacterium]|nr:DUF2993 domain-containing protein [bacterium]
MSDVQRDSRQEHRRRNLAGNILVGTASVLVLLLSLVNFILMPQLDRRLESAVRREFALSEDARVNIHRGMLGRTLRGYLPRFTVESEHAVIDGIPVEDLHFEARGIDFNMRGILRGEKAELTALDFAYLSIKVAEQHLQERLGPLIEAEGLLEPQLSIEEDGVKLVAKKKNKLLGKVKLGAKGRFVADGSPNVSFELGELELGPVNIGLSGLGLDFDQALPVIDMGGFAGDINVDTVRTSPGYLQIGAHTGNPPD